MKALAVTADALPLSDVTTYTGKQPSVIIQVVFHGDGHRWLPVLWTNSFHVVDNGSHLIAREHPRRSNNQNLPAQDF